MIEAPDSWEHTYGYYLNADGKAIKYVNGDLEAYIESINDPDVTDQLTYRPSIYRNGEMVEYPERFLSKSRATDRLTELMREYA